uniref:HAP1 N-terminal domain-containing protein n=1 Tax=Macrostomum lignano TaxID=282301 RepID=A0A1I8HJH3_9PLAT
MGDIEEIKQQLEERDKELALAASLGNDLLDRNRELESKCENLEKLLASERDAAAQLRHELSMKEELLVIYAMNEDRQQSKQAASRSLSVENASSLQKASLERRLHQLESENSELRAAAAAAAAANDRQRWGPDAERETALVKDCVRQLAESNLHIKSLADNLSQRTEMYMEQQNEITQLFAKNVSLESKVKRVSKRYIHSIW